MNYSEENNIINNLRPDEKFNLTIEFIKGKLSSQTHEMMSLNSMHNVWNEYKSRFHQSQDGFIL